MQRLRGIGTEAVKNTSSRPKMNRKFFCFLLDIRVTKRVKTQILKDEELIGEEIKGAHWHFFRSSITGKIGPSEPLKKFLEERGIKYTIHY